jgi:hypothetical protein
MGSEQSVGGGGVGGGGRMRIKLSFRRRFGDKEILE